VLVVGRLELPVRGRPLVFPRPVVAPRERNAGRRRVLGRRGPRVGIRAVGRRRVGGRSVGRFVRVAGRPGPAGLRPRDPLGVRVGVGPYLGLLGRGPPARGRRADQPRIEERLLDGSPDLLADRRLLGEPDLQFPRVDVHVHLGGVDRQIEDRKGVAVRGELCVVGLDDGVPGGRGGDIAAVDERREVVPAGTVGLGVAHETRHTFERSLRHRVDVDVNHRFGDLPPVDGHDGLAAAPLSGRGERLPFVVGQRDPHVGIGQRVARDDGVDVCELRRLLFEVLAPCRHIIKEVPHLDGRARRTARRCDVGRLPALDGQFRATRGVGVTVAFPGVGTGRDGQPRDGSDGVQRLAAKTQRPDPAFEVADVGNLARGVFLDGATYLRFGHARPVVGDPDALGPAGRDHDLEVVGAGVEAVLDQFLDDARGPFDHLAGRDALDGPRVEFADVGHRRRLGAPPSKLSPSRPGRPGRSRPRPRGRQ